MSSKSHFPVLVDYELLTLSSPDKRALARQRLSLPISSSSLTSTTGCPKFDYFGLRSTLKDDYNARKEVEYLVFMRSMGNLRTKNIQLFLLPPPSSSSATSLGSGSLPTNILVSKPKIFTAVDDRLIPKNGAILKWFKNIYIHYTWGFSPHRARQRCDEPTCLYPFTGTTKSKHKAEFYSHGHGFQGALVRVHRRSDGMIPYPCGLEEHARYSFEKLTNLTKQNPHPGPDASEWADHPVEELRNNLPPLPLPLSTMPLLEPTTLETHTFDSFGNDELSSLQTGQLQESDMADENLCNGNEVELPVEEEESAGGMDVGVIDEINAGNGLEDDGEESDESDVLSDDKAEPIEGSELDTGQSFPTFDSSYCAVPPPLHRCDFHSSNSTRLLRIKPSNMLQRLILWEFHLTSQFSNNNYYVSGLNELWTPGSSAGHTLLFRNWHKDHVFLQMGLVAVDLFLILAPTPHPKMHRSDPSLRRKLKRPAKIWSSSVKESSSSPLFGPNSSGAKSFFFGLLDRSDFIFEDGRQESKCRGFQDTSGGISAGFCSPNAGQNLQRQSASRVTNGCPLPVNPWREHSRLSKLYIRFINHFKRLHFGVLDGSEYIRPMPQMSRPHARVTYYSAVLL
ncbi:hypothetical protein F5877DRAFT_71296 [Lentinula edodes]|nr:hypothetical protein F5877DRAFT_71296 [Lentinula edodes]